MFIENFKVESPNVKYTETEIQSVYNYETTELVHENRNGTYQWIVKPKTVKYEFTTDTHVPKLGVMLVGWGGNNGSTLTGGVIANREGISWATKDKIQQANYFGSLTQASAIRVGSFQGEEIYAPFKSLLPMVNPDDIVFGGWDISSMNLADAMARAKVFDIDLQKQLRPYMESMVPLPGIYDPDFIAANQGERANNVIKGTKKEQIQQIIKDIKEFKEANKVDKVVVLWTANTERYSNVVVGLNDTMENLMASVDRDEAEISPSTLYALACVIENVPFINGSPQNTFVPGLIDLAIKRNSLIGGDDFKSGQTKMKSVLVDFLVGAGIKPTSIVSYNHLGNNDGMNLSAPQTFRSKEISKSNVVDDMVNSNAILYEPGEHPDHVVVIKYVPYVGDSKRAMDEYTSEIFMGGKNTIVLHNTCEDSLLAAPIILDLVLLAELSTRIQFKSEAEGKFHSFNPVAAILSYLTKAPLINIIDIPGHVDFTIEVKRALRVVDGAVLVLCGVGGVQSQSITVDRQMRRYEVPRLVFINKLDQVGANPWKVLNQARSKLQHHSAAIQVPIGLEDDFKGLVDLVQLKAYSFHGSNGEKVVAEEVPADMEALVSEKRCELIEAVSKVDDKLAEAFLGNKPISAAYLEEAVRRATIARKFIPVFMGSAFKNKGLQPLLDGVLSYLPCPMEVSSYALDQTKNEKVELPGSPDGPLVALAFKLESCFGQLTCLRIYEGVIRTGGFIINVNTGKKIKVHCLVQMHSNAMIAIEEIEEAHAGQIVVVNGLDCASGDTFTDGSVRYTMTSKKIPEPVMSLAVQPVSKDSGEQVVF